MKIKTCFILRLYFDINYVEKKCIFRIFINIITVQAIFIICEKKFITIFKKLKL